MVPHREAPRSAAQARRQRRWTRAWHMGFCTAAGPPGLCTTRPAAPQHGLTRTCLDVEYANRHEFDVIRITVELRVQHVIDQYWNERWTEQRRLLCDKVFAAEAVIHETQQQAEEPQGATQRALTPLPMPATSPPGKAFTCNDYDDDEYVPIIMDELERGPLTLEELGTIIAEHYDYELLETIADETELMEYSKNLERIVQGLVNAGVIEERLDGKLHIVTT